MLTILIIVSILLVIGLVVWFVFLKKKPSVENPTTENTENDKPKETEEQETPDKPLEEENESENDSEEEENESEEEQEHSQQQEITNTSQPEPTPNFPKEVEKVLDKFASEIKIPNQGTIFNYLVPLYVEAYYQYHKKESKQQLPIFLKEENFPNIYNFYGDKGDEESAFNTLIGWLFALILSELSPTQRTNIFKIGYELGGYNKYSNIYGYKFEYDPNIVRLVAASIYISCRGRIKPDVNKMRSEISTSKYNEDLKTLIDGNRDKVGKNDFFIDLREFMPTAPGPYAPGYTSRPDNTYPNEEKDDFKNLKIDRYIHENIVIPNYNLNNENEEYFQKTVQAIADKEADVEHLFGDNIQTEHYHFYPVFGEETIGIRLDTEGDLADFIYCLITASSSARGILQSASVNPKQYGRLRPGCSWNQEAKKNSKTDDRRNVLTKFEIEDNDGDPTGYYDQRGFWTQPNKVSSPEQYEEEQKNSLWANSYPSGHSSGLFGGGMGMMEIFPDKADLILRTVNRFAINRTIARYHWTSDTINGRVLGSAQNAICHAASDYDELLKKVKESLKEN